jgi:Superinfection immunity protein
MKTTLALALVFGIVLVGFVAYSGIHPLIVIGGAMGASIVLLIYFIPAVVTASRGHHQVLTITLVNLFLGWSLIGWVGALVWAATAVKRYDNNGCLI